MAKRVVLHIGAMKSGTSFIQSVLATNRERLADHGVLFAGRRWRLQVLAAKELSQYGGEGQDPLPPDGRWHQLVDEVNAWPGTAVISMEYFGPRKRDKIEIVKAAFSDADLQVVLTARDLARSIPAMWTESVQNRGVRTWPEFLEAVRAGDHDEKVARWFWGQQSISAMAARWSEVVGRDSFTLITVPPKGAPPSLLWERFASVLGVPAELCEIGSASNPSIDAAAAMVLLGLNERLIAQGLDRQRYERMVKRLLAKRGFAQTGSDRPMVGLDERWVRRRSKKELRRLRRLDPRVVGDIGELEARPVPGVHTRQVTAEQQLGVALDGLAFLVNNLPKPTLNGSNEPVPT